MLYLKKNYSMNHSSAQWSYYCSNMQAHSKSNKMMLQRATKAVKTYIAVIRNLKVQR